MMGGDDVSFSFAEAERWRDVAHLGDCDDSVRALARCLGWETELDALVAAGRAAFEASPLGGGQGSAPPDAESAARASDAMARMLAHQDAVGPQSGETPTWDVAAAGAGPQETAVAARTPDQQAEDVAGTDAPQGLPLGARTHISGTFSGRREGAALDAAASIPPHALHWTLSLMDKGAPGVGAVLAVGAAYRPRADDSASFEYGLIRGTCDLRKGTVDLTCAWEEDGDGTASAASEQYRGSLELTADGGVVLSGRWHAAEGAEGSFSCILEADGGAACMVRRSGVWVGESYPGPEFQASVPANPITWALAVETDAVAGVPRVYGAGFFDDAGDVPGMPCLFFKLKDT